MSLRQSAMRTYEDLSKRSAEQFGNADMSSIQQFADTLSDDGSEIPEAEANTFALHYGDPNTFALPYGDNYPRHHGVPDTKNTFAKSYRRPARRASPKRYSPKKMNTRVCPLAMMYGDNHPRGMNETGVLHHNHAEPVNFELLSSYDAPKDTSKPVQDGNSEYELKDNWGWTNDPKLNRPVQEQQHAIDDPVSAFKYNNQPGYTGNFQITSTDDYMSNKGDTPDPKKFLDASQHYF